MQTDPAQETQRLTAEYRQKSSEELLDIARDFTDLTETAQQALRSEMQNRGLGDPGRLELFAPAASTLQPFIAAPSAGVLSQQAAGIFAGGADMPQLVWDDFPTENEDDGPHDYTWKTELCECCSQNEAVQLQAALSRAGIESWFKFGGYTTPFVPNTSQSFMGGGNIQVLVAADQLDQARAIAAQPIPQDIVEESQIEIPDFVQPKCPKCGADDPVLEGVEPGNSWLCEQCGAHWTDSMPRTEDKAVQE